MPRFSDRAGSPSDSRITPPVMLPSASIHSVGTPIALISRLNSQPARPLPTLRRRPHERPRMTRGHRRSLLLRCRELSSPSSCRFIPAHEWALPRGPDDVRRADRQPRRAHDRRRANIAVREDDTFPAKSPSAGLVGEAAGL